MHSHQLTGHQRLQVAATGKVSLSTVFRWQKGRRIRETSRLRIEEALAALGLGQHGQAGGGEQAATMAEG